MRKTLRSLVNMPIFEFMYFAFNNQAVVCFVVVRQSRFLLFCISVVFANSFSEIKTKSADVLLKMIKILIELKAYVSQEILHWHTLQIYTVFNCVHFPLQSRCTVYIFYHIQSNVEITLKKL